MKAVVLSCGALLVRDGQTEMLFGAPGGVKENLDRQGLAVPDIVMLTQMRAPGFGLLGKAVVRYKEQPLRLNGLSAQTIARPDGTDYVIDSGGARVLFSERGSVSSEEVKGYDLAVVRNKHRANAMPATVLTWPWPDAEFNIEDHRVEPIGEWRSREKVWSSMDEVPANKKSLDGAPLTLEQANYIARVAIGAGGGEGKENWAIGYSSFRKAYKKEDNKWVSRKKEAGDAKMTQDEANYRPMDEAGQCCGMCIHYQEDGSCELVEGVIDPSYVCDWFEAEAEPMDEMAMMEMLHNSEGFAAADHLVVGDPKMITSWHLPVSKNGKPDARLMGAAAAALTAPGGHMGNKYEGPDASEAISKLIAMYHRMKMPLPENLANREKEMTPDGPVRRFGDVLVSNLHTAYNDTTDHWYNEGFMDESERKAVGQAIGEALKALRDSAPTEVMDRVLPAEYVGLPAEFKEAFPELPEQVPSDWTTVFKGSDGMWRWASVTTSVALDDHNEVITPKAIKWALKFNEVIGDKGPLRFRHIPGLDGGDCSHQALVGDYLFEAGTFRDNPVGLAMRKLLQKGTGWRMSPGLLFAPKDKILGVFFRRMLLFERSMTQRPANRFTAILATKENTMTLQLTEQQLKEAADQLELTVDQVRKLYEAASGAGTQLKSVNEFVELVEKETKKVASTTATDEKSAGKVPGKKKPPYLGTESDTEETDEEKMTTKEELADVIRDLTTEERKELRTMLDGVDEADAAGTLALHREVTSLKEMVTTTTAQVNALVAALASNGLQQTQKASSGDSNEAIQTALREILQSAPRAAFVSQRHKESDATEVVDDESIQAELKEIKEQLKQIAPPNGKQLYSLFTSETLNRRSGARK